jgi:hypothetical protein
VISKIEIPDLKSFYFFGEDLYYLHNDKFIFINLLTEKQREVQLPLSTQQAILTDERIIALNAKGKLTLYSYSQEAP